MAFETFMADLWQMTPLRTMVMLRSIGVKYEIWPEPAKRVYNDAGIADLVIYVGTQGIAFCFQYGLLIDLWSYE